MSKILETAMLSYQYYETSLTEIDKVAKQFENLTDLELGEEMRSIERLTNSLASDSVAKYMMGFRVIARIKQLRSIKQLQPTN